MTDLQIDELIFELSRISPMPDDSTVTQAVLDKYRFTVEALARYAGQDKRIIEPLVNSFGTGEGFGLFWSALHALEKFPVSDTLAPLKRGLHAPSAGVRRWSILLLERCGDDELAAIALAATNDAHESVRCEGIRILGNLDSKTFLRIVDRLLTDKSERVMHACKQVLKRLSESSVS